MATSLLQDRRVQQAMAKADENNALQDPAVQKALAQAAVENGLAMGQNAVDFAQRLAKDPEAQRQAKALAVQLHQVAMAMGGALGGQFLSLVEQGPTGVRVLAFVGGCASLLLCVTSVLNPLAMVFGPFKYVVSLYQALFASATMLFEARPEWLERAPVLLQARGTLQRQCPFLATAVGRGLFYIFQASLWLAFASITQLFAMGTGLFLLLIGCMHIAMHFGVMPKEFVASAMSYVGRGSTAPAPGVDAVGKSYGGLKRGV
eukprot:TRINITY_DN46928_c0_g1_i1.p1 TRINITY_DN46928_c0_g1~~TRINITY_DN46928_c0_g1_i1.p1  ORF type:complete len:282 (-),score=48.97 TRINITY_DN46928_c0_g1_i1:291-1073(-)